MADVKQYNRYHNFKEPMLKTNKDIGFIKKDIASAKRLMYNVKLHISLTSFSMLIYHIALYVISLKWYTWHMNEELKP